ncbi:UV-B-induced protein At3g17800, chloroplastic [Linum grandiflorum]
MESALSIHTTLSLRLLPFSSLTSRLSGHRSLAFPFHSGTRASSFLLDSRTPGPAVVLVRAGSEPSSSSSGSLNTPLEPRSAAGKFLTSVFQNQRPLFHIAVADELKALAHERDTAASLLLNSSVSDEAVLHRRIAGLKEQQCQVAVEDVMYMLVLYRFSEIRVPLVPKLSKCVYNGRLEIWPAKDWELESIHTFDVLEMIKEHVSTVIGLRSDSSVTDTWATTQIQQGDLGQLYASSILYGYFLKSASGRHQLDRSLALPRQDLHVAQRSSLQHSTGSSCRSTIKPSVFGDRKKLQSLSSAQHEAASQSLRSYVMGFNAESLRRCAKLKSKEALNLIEKQSCALFGDEKTGLVESDEMIVTSFASLRRLVLEAAAFGTFLWDTEEYVNSVYTLKENN